MTSDLKSFNSNRERIPELDAVRGIACLLVLFAHFWSIPLFLRLSNINLLSGGFIGVDIFFVLSGFLISFLLCSEISRLGTINIKEFYWRRFLRLTPALIISLAFFSLPILALSGTAVWWDDYFYLFTFTTLFPKLLEAYRLLPKPIYFPQTWSLSVEELFYLGFPLLMLAYKEKLLRLVFILIAWFVLGAITMFFSLQVLEGGAYHNPIWHFGQIGMGCIGGIYLFGINSPKVTPGYAWARQAEPYIDVLLNNKGILASAIFYIILVFAIGTSGDESQWLYLGGFPMQTLCILFILLSLTQKHSNTIPVFKSRFLQYIGTISYGAYVFHFPIYLIGHTLVLTEFSAKQGENFLLWMLVDMLLISATLIMAHFSYVLVERRVLRYKKYFSRTAKQA